MIGILPYASGPVKVLDRLRIEAPGLEISLRTEWFWDAASTSKNVKRDGHADGDRDLPAVHELVLAVARRSRKSLRLCDDPAKLIHESS